jgi:hypothetical protein
VLARGPWPGSPRCRALRVLCRGEGDHPSAPGLSAEPPIGIEPMTYALGETATRRTVPSTCGDAFSDTASAVLIGPGRLHFTPRTTPRPRSSDVNEMLPSLDFPMS